MSTFIISFVIRGVLYIVSHIYFRGGKQRKDKERKDKKVGLLALVSIAACVLPMYHTHAMYTLLYSLNLQHQQSVL